MPTKEARKEPETTTQMLTLDMQSDDGLVVLEDETSTVPVPERASFWSKRGFLATFGSSKNEEVAERKKSPLNETLLSEQDDNNNNNSNNGSKKSNRKNNNSLESDANDSNNLDSVDNNAAYEDVLARQDSEFFYQSLDDGFGRLPGAPRLSALLRQVPPPTEAWSSFREKYEKLNYHIDSRLTTVPPEEHDLSLQVELVGRARRVRIVRSNPVELSSLYYLHHGRIILRVPNDHVRLLADPELEPGIVSVEQRRRDVEKQNELYSDEYPELDNLEPLHYVLTVPEDLYKRVVSDMSRGPCCKSDGRADIRLAFALLAIVLVILLISTFDLSGL